MMSAFTLVDLPLFSSLCRVASPCPCNSSLWICCLKYIKKCISVQTNFVSILLLNSTARAQIDSEFWMSILEF